MWEAVTVTNTGYNSMPTSLGIVRMLIHCLLQETATNKLRTSQCPSLSVADITDCANSPAFDGNMLLKKVKNVSFFSFPKETVVPVLYCKHPRKVSTAKKQNQIGTDVIEKKKKSPGLFVKENSLVRETVY